MISPNVRKDGFQHPGIFGLWNPESGKVLLVKSKILGFGICDSTQGIRNPADSWNPDESSIFDRYSEKQYLECGSTAWNPESTTVRKSHVRLLFVDKKKCYRYLYKNSYLFFSFLFMQYLRRLRRVRRLCTSRFFNRDRLARCYKSADCFVFPRVKIYPKDKW